MDMPVSDLSRARVSEPEQDWPDELVVTARWGKKERRFAITKDAYFGTGVYGAPMSGDQLLRQIDFLRKAKPKLSEM